MFPSSRILVYNNTLGDRYIGLVPSTELDYSTLLGLVGVAGIGRMGTYRNFQFFYSGKDYIIPSQPICIASYKVLYEKGLVWGTDDAGPDLYDTSVGIVSTVQNATLTVQGRLYRVRCFRGTLTNTVSSLLTNDPMYYNPMTEWERFYYSTWNDLPAGYTKGFEVPSTDQVPLHRLSSSTRRWAMACATDGSRTAPRCVGRGRFDTNAASGTYNFSQICSTTLSPLLTASQDVWWPILESY